MCPLCLCVQRSRSGCGSVEAVWRSCPAAEWVTSSGRNTRTSSPRETPTPTSSKSSLHPSEFLRGFIRALSVRGLFHQLRMDTQTARGKIWSREGRGTHGKGSMPRVEKKQAGKNSKEQA